MQIKKYALLLCLVPLSLHAQDFNFKMEYSGIPLEVDGCQLAVPWTGGYCRSSVDYCDIDTDGDKDLFVGNSTGFVSLFRNFGNATTGNFILEEEVFSCIDVSDWVGYSMPVFWDMDSDSDYDLLVGSGRSLVRVYINIGTPEIPVYEVWDDTLKDLNGDWFYCDRPQFVDIDNDGDDDLFCGRFTGVIDYYENIGDSTNYCFQATALGLQGINVGYSSSPELVDIDSDGDYDLFVGNKYGYIYYYQNIGTPEQYAFADPIYPWLGIDVGDYASPEFCDIDDDGDYDLFIGKDNYNTFTVPGAVHYWENVGDPQNPSFVQVTQSYLTFDAGWSTSVDFSDIDQDGDLDLFFITNALLGWMENVGTVYAPSFALRSYDLIGYMSPSECDLGDLNGDGAPDLVVSDGYGQTLRFYQNTSLPGQLIFEEVGSIFTGYSQTDVSLADMDFDGDNDILLGGFDTYPSGAVLIYYENIGSPSSPHFSFVTDDYQGISSMNLGEINPCAADVDIDGDFDLLLMYNYFTSEIWYFENVGTPQQAQLDSVTNDFLGIDLYYGIDADCADIDGDGDVDVFGGRHMSGGISFFRNRPLSIKSLCRQVNSGSSSGSSLTLHYNPGYSFSEFSFTLPTPQDITLAVYNLLGRKVTTIISGRQPAGTHSFLWNPSQYSSGVYIIRLETPQEAVAKRVMVVN